MLPAMDAQVLATLPLWMVAFLLSLTCHEAAHAWAAKRGGDRTAERQVTLDPIPHIKQEPFGTIVVPILSFFLNGGGWMLGWASAPFDPRWAERHPKRAALMALAGPVANFVLVLVSAAAIHGGIAGGWLAPPAQASFERIVVTAQGDTTALTMFLSVLFSLNLLLGCFNLFPFPPLDGHAVVPLFLSERATVKWHSLFRQQGAAMMGLIVAWMVFGRVFSPIFGLALNALYPGSGYA